MNPEGTRVFHSITGGRSSELEGMPLAGFAARASAFLLDFAIVIVLFMAASLPGALQKRTGSPSQELVFVFDPFDSLWGLAGMVAYFGLATYLGKGRTVGKWLLRLRVVSLVHERLSLWHCIERALGYAASALEGGFGFVQVFIHPNRQTVHDRIAETIVIVEPRRPKMADDDEPADEEVPAEATPSDALDETAGPDAERPG